MKNVLRVCSAWLLLVTVGVVDAHATAPARGYQGRACGFDMNHNGTRGEPADCKLCCGVGTSCGFGDWDPLESTCRHASLSIL